MLASQHGNRVVVGVSKTGGGEGNRIDGPEEPVVRLTFRVLATGATDLTLAGSPANPQNPTGAPAALDSAGAVVPGVTFDAAPSQIVGA